MRLVVVDHSSLPGGGQLGLIRYLRRPSRFERVLVVLDDGFLAEEARRAGIEVHVLPSETSWSGALRSGPRIRSLVKDLAPDAILANSLRAANILGIYRTKGPVHIGYLREDLSPASIGGLKRPVMMHGTLNRLDAFLANSEWTATTVPPVLSGKPMRVAYPVSGLETRGTADALPPTRHAPLRLLSLSRLAPWKGIHVLLEALALIAAEGRGGEIATTVAGAALFADGAYGEELLARAERISSRIEFVGHRDDIDGLLASHDVLVHCSTRPEPYGQVIPQSMHAGLVTIATDGGGPAELLDDGVSGILTTAGDFRALADAILWTLDHPEESARIARSARDRAAVLTDDVTAAALDAALEALILEARDRR